MHLCMTVFCASARFQTKRRSKASDWGWPLIAKGPSKRGGAKMANLKCPTEGPKKPDRVQRQPLSSRLLHRDFTPPELPLLNFSDRISPSSLGTLAMAPSSTRFISPHFFHQCASWTNMIPYITLNGVTSINNTITIS